MAVLVAVYAVAGLLTGHVSFFDAIGLVFGSGTVAAIRGAIGKIE